MTDPLRHATNRPHPRASRRHMLGACALLAALAGPALAAPDPNGRLREIAALLERDNTQARTILVQEGPGLIAGAPYPTRMQYLRLLRRAHADAGSLPDVHATNEQIIALADAEGDDVNLALASLGRAQTLITNNQPGAGLALLATLGARYGVLGNAEFNAGIETLHGSAYSALGQYDRALGHFLRALEIVRAHPAIWTPREADIRLALARMYINLRDPARAIETLGAIDTRGKPLPPRTAASIPFFEGRALVAQGELAGALDAYARALAIARQHGLSAVEANTLGDIANAYLKARRFADAETAARAALAMGRSGDGAVGRQVATANLGFALFGQGREQEGLRHIDAVLAELRGAGALSTMVQILVEKSQALEARGRYREALAATREREALAEQLALNERNKAISALQEQFKARESAARIATLSRDNAVKDTELRHRELLQGLASLGAALALFLCAGVLWLYRKSLRTGRRLTELNDELAYRSAHDPLTGLFNRRSFHDRMRSRTGQPQAHFDAAECFTLLDIDHFKRINDEYGHAVGDAVLVEIGKRLRGAVRESDMVLRWGGVEFLIYSQGVSQVQRPLLVRRILEAIAATPVLLDDGTALQVSVTAGAVSLPFGPEREARLDWEQAIALADRALYKGKEAGRNRGYIVAGLPRPDAAPHEGLRLDLILPHAPA